LLATELSFLVEGEEGQTNKQINVLVLFFLEYQVSLNPSPSDFLQSLLATFKGRVKCRLLLKWEEGQTNVFLEYLVFGNSFEVK